MLSIYYENMLEKVSGRYQVTWSWKDKTAKLSDNYELCVGKLKSLYEKTESRSRTPDEIWRNDTKSFQRGND